MRNIYLFIFLLVCFSNAYSIDMKKYQVKSGIVEYSISGIQTGKQTLYFDNWGLLSAEYTQATTTFMGMTVPTNTLSLTTQEWTYNIDLDKKEGTKIANKEIEELMKSLQGKDLEEIGRKMLEKLNAKKIGNETFLGKNCEVWEIQKLSSKVWLYKYIPLKTISNIMGTITIEATKFEENVSIPADKLKVPSGIKITEQKFTDEEKQNMEEIMKMMQNGQIDPEKLKKLQEQNEENEEGGEK
ncbi:MAG: hypothetical protein ACPL1A_05945 [Candidatus Kapaibacteriota bacterium]